MAEAPQAKIPPTVDLKDTDPDRQELYGKAGKVFTEERRKAKEAREGQVFVPEDQPEPGESYKEPEKKPEIEVDEADKRAFVRSILGDKAFEKLYALFGGEVEVTFVDRTSEEMDRILAQLEKIEDETKWSQEADVACLCSSLREIKSKEGRKSYPPTDKMDDRAAELKKLPRPLWETLLDTSRNFETLVNHMIEKSRDPDFWQAGGRALPSKRTAGVPSTSPRLAGRTSG